MGPEQVLSKMYDACFFWGDFMKSVYLLHHTAKVFLLAGFLRVTSLSPPPEFLASPSEKISLLHISTWTIPCKDSSDMAGRDLVSAPGPPVMRMAARDAMTSESPRSCSLCLPDPARQSLHCPRARVSQAQLCGAKKPRRELSYQWQPLPFTELRI